MSKTSNILLLIISLLFLIHFIYTVVTYSEPKTKTTEQHVHEKLITIKIDGEEYLYGHLNGNTVLVPKVKSCNCKCENK